MPNLSKRNFTLEEEMDASDCDPSKLENTYLQFTTINSFLSGWKRIYLRYLKEIILNTPEPTLLDIGFGGGDIAIKLNEWAKKDKINLGITAIETDPRSLDYINKLPRTKTKDINFRIVSLKDLVKEGKKFDLVISNHVLHHLSNEYLRSFLTLSREIANQIVIHNDLERGSLAYNIFKLSKFLFKDSFITNDGLISIQRSFTKPELTDLSNNKWEIIKFQPFRLLAVAKK